MNGRALVLMIALVCGLAAMLGVRALVSRSGEKHGMVELVAASRDIQAEEVLKPDMVRTIEVAEGSEPSGSFRSFQDVVDRWVRIPMLSGEVILDGKLAPKGEMLGLRARIPAGMRACTIEVNEHTGVSGFVLPDHRVDVILARSSRSDLKGEPAAETILQNVLVLAAGTVMTHPEDKSVQVRSVTLAVSPPEAASLASARNEGTLSLALRGPGDGEITKEAPIAEPLKSEQQNSRAMPVPVEAPRHPELPARAIVAVDPLATATSAPAAKLRSIVIYRGPKAPGQAPTAEAEYFGMPGIAHHSREELARLHAQQSEEPGATNHVPGLAGGAPGEGSEAATPGTAPSPGISWLGPFAGARGRTGPGS